MAKAIYINNTELTNNKQFTYLASDATAGGTALVVQSILGFQGLSTSSGQLVCIGEIVAEKTEILRTDQNNAASGTTVSLRDALVFSHPQDTKVYIIDWNRVEVDWASTTTGSKSTIAAYPYYIQPDLPETIINDSSQTSGFYFVRFNETIGNTNSDWSDPIPFVGFADNTVWAVKDRALQRLHEVIDGKVITDDYLNRCLWEARREYHNSPGKRPFRRKYDTDIGDVVGGMYRVVMPDDVENSASGDNVYGVRIGANSNMSYYDKKQWDKDYENIRHSTLAVAYTVGDQDLYLSNVRDFDSSGTVTIEGDSISYSAIGISGGTMRISSNGNSNHSISLDVWQNASYSLPTRFTVFADPAGSSYIYFNCPVSTSYVNQNIYEDYYRTLVDYDSDADVLDEPEFDMYVDYLCYKIKERKNRGDIPVIHSRTGPAVIADADYQNWLMKKSIALGNEHLGVDIHFIPEFISEWPQN